MHYNGELRTILKYDNDLDLLHIYNKLLNINNKIYKKYQFELKDIRTVNPKYRGYETFCIKSDYEKKNIKLQIKINYFKEDKCLLDNIKVRLSGKNISSEELIDISNIINNVFKGEVENDD